MDQVLADLRFAFRLLTRAPGFAATAILVLALGIGANSAIFSVVDAVLIRLLPYADPGRLVTVWEDAAAFGTPKSRPAPANFVDWHQQDQVFTGIAAMRSTSLNLSGGGPPEEVAGRAVGWNLFPLLGVRPFAPHFQRGRGPLGGKGRRAELPLMAAALRGRSRVQPGDASTLAWAAAVLFMVAVAACAVPAWRAARVDPTDRAAAKVITDPPVYSSRSPPFALKSLPAVSSTKTSKIANSAGFVGITRLA